MKRLHQALNTPRDRTPPRGQRPARPGGKEAWLSGVAEPIVDQLWDVARSWEDHKRVHREQRRQRKYDERMRRVELKRASRRARSEGRTRAEGYVQLFAALMLALFAAFRPEMWWLVFVAIGLGTQGVRVLASSPAPDSEAGSKKTARLPQPEPERAPSPPLDPRDARVDGVCGRILAELKASPEGVRDLGSRPERTIEALRTTCLELTRRERELRALLGPDDDRRLAQEREQLVARISGEQDAIVRQRLEGALGALDGQVAQRKELSTSAARFEAEHTRLGYTLEGMYTQLLRVRSADAASRDLAGAGLRQSVEQLGAEIDAVAEALEEVNRGDLSPIAPIADSNGDMREDATSPVATGNRERS
jgi:hypothetical protein